MALVTSDQSMTVIILDNTEAEALADIFETFGRLMPELDELANAMLGEKMAFAYENDEETTDIDRKRP